MPDKEPLPADVARADSPTAMARRLASPAHIAQLCGWCARVAREEGAQALWREIDFRLRLALHKDTWRYRADLPTRRQLRRQKAAGVPGRPHHQRLCAAVQHAGKFLRQLIRSLRRQSWPHWQLVLADASDADHPVPGLHRPPGCRPGQPNPLYQTGGKRRYIGQHPGCAGPGHRGLGLPGRPRRPALSQRPV